MYTQVEAKRSKCGVPVPFVPPPPEVPAGMRLRANAVPPPPLSCRLLPLNVWRRLFDFFPLDFCCNTLLVLCRVWSAGVKRDLLPRARALTVRSCKREADALACVTTWSRVAPDTIERVSFERCAGATNTVLDAVAQLLPRVHSVRVDACDECSDDAIVALLQTRAASLTSVALAHCVNTRGLTQATMRALIDAARLQRAAPVEAPLRELVLCDMPARVVAPPTAAPSGSGVRTKAAVKGAPTASTSAPAPAPVLINVLLADALPVRSLRIVRLERARPFMRDNGTIVALDPALVGADFVTDATLVALQSCDALCELSLSGMCAWTQTALVLLLRALPRLRMLDVSRCAHVDDRLAVAVVRAAGTRLHELRLLGCDLLTDGVCANLTQPYCPTMLLVELPDQISYDAFCALRRAQRAFVRHAPSWQRENVRELQQREDEAPPPPPPVPDNALSMLEWSAKFCPHHVGRPKTAASASLW